MQLLEPQISRTLRDVEGSRGHTVLVLNYIYYCEERREMAWIISCYLRLQVLFFSHSQNKTFFFSNERTDQRNAQINFSLTNLLLLELLRHVSAT